MRGSVWATWPDFVADWEGRVPHLYLDTRKLATFGIGRMVDTGTAITDYGLTRPWRDDSGALVLEKDIRTEYGRIKSHPELAPLGGDAYRDISRLHLQDRDIDEALADTTQVFWSKLLTTLPALEAWPADAQLGLLDMAYHLGPGFLGLTWPNFTRAAKAAEFAGCADQCQTAEKTRRDAAHVKLFRNASAATYADLSLSRLWWPDTPTVDSWPVPGPALAVLSTFLVTKAQASTFSSAAWYVQRMLKLAGTYTSTVDGLFGPVSKNAWTTWAKKNRHPTTLTVATLGALSKATLRMPVVV